MKYSYDNVVKYCIQLNSIEQNASLCIADEKLFIHLQKYIIIFAEGLQYITFKQGLKQNKNSGYLFIFF